MGVLSNYEFYSLGDVLLLSSYLRYEQILTIIPNVGSNTVFGVTTIAVPKNRHKFGPIAPNIRS